MPASGPSDAPSRNLSEILEELAQISTAQRGEASAMRGAVSELSRALARLFEMIRADRATQHTRIAELEEALAQAQAQVRQLELEQESGAQDAPGPSPTDFDQLREAAERLRVRTEQLVQEAGTPAEEEARAVADATRAIEDDRIEAARLAVEASLAEEEAEAARRAADEAAASAHPPTRPVHDEPFGAPGILRIFPGAVLRPGAADEFDVESDLGFDEEAPRQAIAQHFAPSVAEPPSGRDAGNGLSRGGLGHAPAGLGTSTGAVDGPASTDMPAPADRANPAPSADQTGNGDQDGADGGPAPSLPTLVKRPEPVAVGPRVARKRRAVLRRRRIDARKLTGVDAAAALRAMVSAVDDVWTAGHALDLVVALTDGGALHVAGGDREPLRVAEVESGTSARCTVTATSAQIVPLFGRLDLTADQSAPLIHGTRRDADLLVGWIDRAQRLTAEPL